jgi:RNA polymerase sigma factor (sigma-70 family)
VLPPFQSLVDDHAKEVHRYLLAMVGRDHADDCLQETLLAALRAYTGLADGSNLRAWLYTIARRKAIDAIRTHRRTIVDGARVAAAADAVPAHTSADDGLWSEVRSLPPKQRAAVVHRFVDDLAYRDVATRIGTSEEAARRNVHEGLKKLRMRIDR